MARGLTSIPTSLYFKHSVESETPLLEAEAFLCEVEAALLENKAVSFIFGSEDIFIAFTGTRFPFMRMDGISGFDFKA